MTDLNDHLFAQLERLGDEELSPEDLKKEISRSKAISDVAKQVIDNQRVLVSAVSTQAKYGMKSTDLPEQLALKDVQ